MEKIRKVITAVMFLSVLLMYPVSVQAGDRDEVIEMEEIDLTTGEVSTYELPLYDDNETCDAIDGFSGEVPEPISIIGSDDRNRVTKTTRKPYRQIGMMEMHFPSKGDYVGTGFLVGKKIALTAAHNLYDSGEAASRVRFSPGRNGSSFPYGTYTVAKLHIPKKYKEATSFDEREKYDYALLEFSTDLGTSLGYFGLGGYNTQYNENTLSGTQATVVGYPGTKNGQMYRHKSTIIGFNTEKYHMNYVMDTEGGQSGSPVIKYVDGKYYVVAIHILGGSTYNTGRYVTKNIYELVNKYR